MKFQKGNKLGGRRPAVVEDEKKIEKLIDSITNEALIELAKSKVLAQIRQLSSSKKTFKKVMSSCLPLVLKGIKQTSSVEVQEVKPLLSAIRDRKDSKEGEEKGTEIASGNEGNMASDTHNKQFLEKIFTDKANVVPEL